MVKTALLGARDAADIGVPAIPLGDLHGRAAATLLGRLGAQVRLAAKAAEVAVLPPARADAAAARFRVRLAERRGGNGQGVIEADGVVLAVPPEVAARLMPAHADGDRRRAGRGQPGPAQWRELATSPIVNVHVIYDRRVTRLPFAGGGRLAGAVGFRPDRPVRAAGRPVPRDLAVGGGQLRGRPGVGAAGAVPACPGGTAARRAGRTGHRLFRHQGAAGHAAPGAWMRAAAATGRHRRCRGWCWPVRGPTPDGRTRWREPCGAD